ncbi:hypothetical protein [Frateuria defendens]|uniref:hypothetical protein n=1 Tax=Frateuria defendens TaxID=2219559 RepID=UPI00066FCF2C|nr:hypothetical protein [Frateuria defendens]
MTSAPALGFDYRPSRRFGRALRAVLVLAMLAVLLSGLPLWSQGLLLGGAAAIGWRSLRAQASSTVSAAGWGAEGDWTLRLAGGEDVPARLASHRVLGPLVLLRLVDARGHATALLLAGDNSDADLRRRLRMRLATAHEDESDAAGTFRAPHGP